MKTHRQLVITLVTTVTWLLVSESAAWAAEGSAAQPSKEVIKREDGKDRHWVIKSNGLIVEEHGLTAHGDLHLMVEYAKGVQSPQIDALSRDTNAASVTTIFWPTGRRNSSAAA